MRNKIDLMNRNTSTRLIGNPTKAILYSKFETCLKRINLVHFQAFIDFIILAEVESL